MNGLSVVIPSRTDANLVPCLEAVRRHEPGARLIVIDDGLKLDWLPRPDLMPAIGHKTGKPFVFARACNAGIGLAESDDVILLNDDALLETPGGFTAMQQLAAQRPEYGLIASTCNNVGNVNQWRKPGDGLRDEPRMVCFVCVLIPRRTIDLVGLLDERYVDYGCDDDDYSFSVRAAGLKIGIFDGCYVDHGKLTSTFRGSPGRSGDFQPNLKRFIEKWGTDNWGKDRQHSQFRHLFPEAVGS